MNNVEKMFVGASAEAFSLEYAEYFGKLIRSLNAGEVAQLIEAILNAREQGRRIFFIGNGGSAATASHFANDVAIGTRSGAKPFRAVSLTDNNAVMTAIANDDGYEQLFVKQLEALMEPGDVLVAISASGNSPNLVAAVEHANARGAVTVGLTGFDGGRLRKLCSSGIHVPSEKGEYGPVEAVHSYVLHLVGNYLMQRVIAERRGS